MTRFHVRAIACAALLGACNTGSIKLGGDDTGTAGGTDVGGTVIDGGGTTATGTDGDGGATDGGATDGGGTDGGGTDGGGTDGGGTDGGETSADWTGIYVGTIDISATDDWSNYDLGSCDTTLVVDPSQALTGAAVCNSSGMSGATPIEGTVSDDGQIDAMANLDLGWGSTTTLDVTGDINTDGLMSLEVYGEVDLGWDTAIVDGWGELFRE